MFSVYDAKAGAFNTPFFMATDEMAIRGFTDACNDPQTMFHKHPADFVLYLVGTFNDQTGETVGYSPALHVAAAAQLVSQALPLFDGKE